MNILGFLGEILQVAGLILFHYYGWVPLVGVVVYLTWQNRRRVVWHQGIEQSLLLIEVPKENEKDALSAEQMFAALHGILRPKSDLTKEGSLQEYISFEIASIGNRIHFYVWTPKHLKDFVEGQIYAQYPSVHIKEVEDDYAGREHLKGKTILGTELALDKDPVLPIKTYESFAVDPISSITQVLSKLDDDEEIWIQVLARPIEDGWSEAGKKFLVDLKGGKKGKTLKDVFLELPLHIVSNSLHALAAPPEEPKEDKKDDKKDEDPTKKSISAAVSEKVSKLGYEAKIRLVYLGTNSEQARLRMQALIGSFKQYNTLNLNAFVTTGNRSDEELVEEYRARFFPPKGSIMNTAELASIFHLPHKSVETPNIVWNTERTSEPPPTLPIENEADAENLSLFGLTNFRGQRLKFGIKRRDRGRHLYVIGQTGTGKSMLLQLLTLSDIYQDQGFAIVDPHGDLATDIMKYIPEERVKDVIYFNPADIEFPIAFNPMEVTDPNFKNNISSEIVGVLKRMFESWGPRLEYILRFTILALLDYPDSTLLGITRMLTDKEFRKKVVREVQDPVVKNFWLNEFASWNDKFANEAVAPVLNKVGAFTANPLVRNVIGQPKSAINLRKLMDEGKILIVNLSQGLIGEDNASILGALMVTKLQLAAMSRANLPLDQRRPFYLYVDEFQNFATDSFAVILSEARKYGLYLTVANQYIAQIAETAVKDAVFGNVGSIVTFRVGADDATYLAKYFKPVFEDTDIVTLNNQHILISMSIDGEKSPPFSATTLMMPEPVEDMSASIIARSRQDYASSKAEVTDAISNWSYDMHQKTRGAMDEEAAPGEDAPVRMGEQKANTPSELKNPEPRPVQQEKKPEHNRDHDRDRDRRDRPKHHQPEPRKEQPAVNTHNQPGELHQDEVVKLHQE